MTFRVLGCAKVLALSAMAASGQVVGPLVGQVGDADARFLYRTNAEVKNLRVTVQDRGGNVFNSDTVTTASSSDYTAHFHVTGLSPSTVYDYRVEQIETNGLATLLAGDDGKHQFRTFPGQGERTIFTAAFTSCANSSSEPVWERIDSLNPNALFLMGDTPYVDTSVLATVRQKHRDFLSTPFLKGLVRHVPTNGTWDDHDFGANNGNGKSVTGKAVNRQVFTEYRAHSQYGTGTQGVYYTVPCGPMEVFMLDDRWFSQTTTSPVSPTQPTCFGSEQWTWLLNALKQSRAPFKVLAFGAIWQDKVYGSENDDMHTYLYERDALLNYIREQKIPGVVLLGGDIHISRHYVHPQRVGYDLHDFVVSPAHTSTIPGFNMYNPEEEWTSVQPRQFLTISVDTRVQPAVLTAKFMLADGTVQRTITIPYDQLVPKSGNSLANQLRAYWPFDGVTENKAVLGSRVDATLVNGAAVNAGGGVRGGAASLQAASSQYLKVSRSLLPENTDQYTASAWVKASSLPAHGSSTKAYLMETTPAGDVSAGSTGFGISLGIGAGASADKVAIILNTHTFRPAATSTNGTTSPTPLAQGPFTAQVDRSALLNDWANFTVTFNSNQLGLYLNGTLVNAFALPIPGPLTENGGMIIGGNRAGAGQNFDGLIDEVAVWSRALESAEVSAMWNGGSPPAIPTSVAMVDSDGDSLPDWWEGMNGLDAQNASDAISDADGDKIPAYVELAMGTSPLHNDSTFYNYIRQMAAPGRSADATTFRDPANDNVSVRLSLETSTDLEHWTPLSLGSPEAGIEAIDSLLKLKLPPVGGSQRYYRFQAKAPQR